jgi:hypothetical protein
MMNKSDADTADIAIIIDHLIPKGDSKHFSLKRLFTRIRGYAIIKPITGSIDKNQKISHDTATIIPIGIAKRMPEKMIADIE